MSSGSVQNEKILRVMNQLKGLGVANQLGASKSKTDDMTPKNSEIVMVEDDEKPMLPHAGEGLTPHQRVAWILRAAREREQSTQETKPVTQPEKELPGVPEYVS